MRLLLQPLATLAISCLLLISGAAAHSKSRNPLNYLSLLENPRIHTPSQRVHASSHFDLTFDLHGESEHIRLSLEPNHDIVHEDSYVEFLDQYGNVRHAEKMQREDYKVYQGKSFVVDEDGLSTYVGWARIVVRRDGVRPLFEGAFTVMGNHHHIQMKSTYTATKHLLDPELDDDEDEYMAVWRDSDVSRQVRRDLKREADVTCASDRLAFNTNPGHPIFRDLVLKRDDGYWGSMSMSNLLGKRQSNIDGGGAGNGNSAGVNLKSTIGSTAGCPTTRKVALIGIATDCTYTASFNSTDTVRQHIITQVNTASDLYQSTFNITLGLRNLTVSDSQCPGTASSTTPWNLGCTGNNQTMDSRLNLFSGWRGERGDTNAYWSLFTTCSTDAEVGVAWLGQLCNTGSTSQQDTSGTSQSVTGANVVAKTSTEWQVFAHESGHTFGAVHDCDSSTCADANTVNSGQCCPLSSSTCDANAQYMMNPYASSSISTFSPCSIGNICSALGRNSVQSGCLTDNKGVVTITGNQCGNGIVEEGEDCDCGGTEGCSGNTCCNATTCKFNEGAVCDPSNEGCCTTSCQFSSAGTVCRASTGACDPQEVCAGTNGTCPADSTAPDGTSCTSGNTTGLQCASGQCTSRNLQCKTLMGSYTSDNDTYACDSQSCTISCASPSFGANVCYSMQQNFLDGTPCNGDGKCNNGVCRGSTVGGEVKSWINSNKTLVIALASALGGILLLAILGCCVRACRRRRPKKYGATGPRRGPAAAAAATRGWDGPQVPSQMRERGYGNTWQTSPVDIQPPQGPTNWAPPQPPMPSQQNWYPSQPPPSYGAWGDGYAPPRGNSVRYA